MSAPPIGRVDDIVSIEQDLRALERDSQRGPRIVADAYAAWQEAERDYEIARARAHLKARQTFDGKPTVADLEAEVLLNTITERSRAEVAEQAHRYAVSRVKELESRRSSLQTRAKLVMEQMRLVGSGAGA